MQNIRTLDGHKRKAFPLYVFAYVSLYCRYILLYIGIQDKRNDKVFLLYVLAYVLLSGWGFLLYIGIQYIYK